MHTQYGPPDVLQIKEVVKPVPKDNEVLIKIFATSVTSGDCNARSFEFVPGLFWLPARIIFGFTKPKINILGTELAGEIEATGKDVKLFNKGDQVFALSCITYGGHAEYVCMPEDGVLAAKPSNLTFDEAVAVPFGAHSALFFIKDQANVQPGQKVLIYGASGGIGTYAVQLAKYYGAEVTGVCSTANLDMVKSLGADHVIDYTKEDFAKSNEAYDVIFDTVGKISFSHCKSLLKQKGVYLAASMNTAILFQMLWTSITGGKKVMGGVAIERQEDLLFFKKLIEAGKLKPVIDRRYPFEQIVDAFKYVEQGHKKGNVVITLGS